MQRRDFIGGMVGISGLGALGAGAKAGPTGLAVPPEDAMHQRTFMQWPVSQIVHPDPVFRGMIQQTIADIANVISEFETVTLLMAPEFMDAARKKLSSDVEIWNIPTDDLWCRDAGPLFARKPDGGLAISHLQFNGWGGKQHPENDGLIAGKVAERLGLELISSGLTGEAGGVEHDGHGLLMAHESSWINPNRNPGLDRDEIGARLLAAYGAERIIWTKGVMGQDITDYHIDSLARFTGPGRVLINLPDEPDMSDPFHLAAMETHAALEAAGLEIEVIPEPEERRVDSLDFVTSYANYYVCNDAVIAAEFGDEEADAIAVDALLKHYPGREVVTLNVDPLGETGGGIHCATQQMPE